MTDTACTMIVANLAGREGAEALGAALEAFDPAPDGVGVFEIEDGSGRWEVSAYFEQAPDPVQIALVEAAHGVALLMSDLPETDWVSHVQRELAPVEAGRFWLYGSHDADSLPPGKVALLIEASMAFGTGHHDTTRACLLALDGLADGPAPSRIADIGCGTAVLAMAAAQIWPEAEILASDNDPTAIEVSEANLSANGMAGQVTCLVAEGFDHSALSGPFTLIFANILKPPLLALAGDMAARLAPGGHIVLSGILQHQADEVQAAYEAQGLRRKERLDLGEWSALILTR